MTSSPRTLAEAIDAIEGTYEFMLAYAAQGRVGEDADDIRDRLSQAEEGLSFIASLAAPDGGNAAEAAFVEVVRVDAVRALTALRFVLAQRVIGSQMIDNLNASIHLRTLLTDLFLLDEALRVTAAG